MKKRNIIVSFPLDRRTDSSRNNLLDGKNHTIEVDQMSTFDLDNQHFYIVVGFDFTRRCNIVILLIRKGNELIKVPLLDYDELKRHINNSRILSESEVQSLLDRNGDYVSTMPLTTISNIVAQSQQVQNEIDSWIPSESEAQNEIDSRIHSESEAQNEIDSRIHSESEIQSLFDFGRDGNFVSSIPLTTIPNILMQSQQVQNQDYNRQKIMVFYDIDGRKFILSSAAEYLGLLRPKSIKYLPLKNIRELAKYCNIYGPDWYRLLSEEEYELIIRNFDIRREDVDNVDVIEYEGQYFIKRPIFEGNDFGLAHAFYDFGDNFFDCVQINSSQKYIIDKYYTTDYKKRRLFGLAGDPSRREPEPWPEEINIKNFRM